MGRIDLGPHAAARLRRPAWLSHSHSHSHVRGFVARLLALRLGFRSRSLQEDGAALDPPLPSFRIVRKGSLVINKTARDGSRVWREVDGLIRGARRRNAAVVAA